MRNSKRFSIKEFLSAQGALATVEFALFAPLLFVLFFGVVELTRYEIILQKVERTAYAISNMVVQYVPAKEPQVDVANEITVDKINNEVFPQLEAVMEPYNAAGDMRAIITSVVKTNDPAPDDLIILWQISGGGTLENANTISIVNGLQPSAIDASVVNTTATFNADILATLATMQIGENMIVVEMFYDYRPILADILTNFNSIVLIQETMFSRIYAMPRQGNLVSLPPTFPVP